MRDISDVLDEWPYDPGSCARKIVGQDGRELIQVRTPLGIEQYELEGRPDGARPYGCGSVLEYVEQQLSRDIDDSGGPESFEIDRATGAELQQEGLVYYCRYLVCFQIGEYELVAGDTARNLKMFDLVSAYCKDTDIVHGSEQYRPYVLRMNAAARALLAVGVTDYARAKSIIRKAIERVAALPDVPTPTFEYEKERSLAILRGMRKAIPKAKPPTEEEVLKRELSEVIEQEDYERAAEIRDQLRELNARRDQPRSPARRSTHRSE